MVLLFQDFFSFLSVAPSWKDWKLRLWLSFGPLSAVEYIVHANNLFWKIFYFTLYALICIQLILIIKI